MGILCDTYWVFEHQVFNKEVGPPFRGLLVPYEVLASKFWTLSNWMFTLHWKLWGMKEVEIHFALSTPGHSIKAQWCSDLLIEEVMEAIWRQTHDHFWLCLLVFLWTISTGNKETCVRNRFGSTWSLKWPYIT